MQRRDGIRAERSGVGDTGLKGVGVGGGCPREGSSVPMARRDTGPGGRGGAQREGRAQGNEEDQAGLGPGAGRWEHRTCKSNAVSELLPPDPCVCRRRRRRRSCRGPHPHVTRARAGGGAVVRPDLPVCACAAVAVETREALGY